MNSLKSLWHDVSRYCRPWVLSFPWLILLRPWTSLSVCGWWWNIPLWVSKFWMWWPPTALTWHYLQASPVYQPAICALWSGGCTFKIRFQITFIWTAPSSHKNWITHRGSVLGLDRYWMTRQTYGSYDVLCYSVSMLPKQFFGNGYTGWSAIAFPTVICSGCRR